MSERRPIVFPCGHFIAEEMKARGWSIRDVVMRMGWTSKEEYGIDYLTFALYLACSGRRDILLGEDTAAKLGRVFDISPQLFLNLHKAWIDSGQEEAEPCDLIEQFLTVAVEDDGFVIPEVPA